MFQNLTLKTRLYLLTLTGFVFMFTLGLLGVLEMTLMFNSHEKTLISLQNASAATVSVQKAHAHFKTQVQEWKNILIRGNDEEIFEKHLTQFGNEEKKVQSEFNLAINLMKGLDLPLDAINKLAKNHEELGAKYRQALNSFDKADPNSGKNIDKLVKGLDRDTAKGMDKIVSDIEMHFAQRIKSEQSSNLSNYEGSKYKFSFLILIGLLATIIISLRISSKIMHQLGGDPSEVVAITKRISSGCLNQANFSQSFHENSVLANIEVMRQSLRNIVEQIQTSSFHLIDASQQLALTGHKVSTSSERQYEATASMAAAVEEMTVSINHISDDAFVAQENAAISGETVELGLQVVDQTINKMTSIMTTTAKTSEDIRQLAAKSEQIGAVVNVIKEIADQTNLLALNAAIEAARAGETGRGFAVVADEVRKLAERTRQSTLEIVQTIKSIQESTRQSIDSTEISLRQANEGARLAENAGTSMRDVKKGIGSALTSVTEISHTLVEQKEVSNQVAKNVEQIAFMTEENAISVKNLNQSALEIAISAEELKKVILRFTL